MQRTDGSTVVLGVGNELMRDEGVGVIAARALASEQLGGDVEVVEGGTGGLDLIFELEGHGRAIIIDAVDMGAEPGTVRSFTLDDVDIDTAAPIASLHQIGLADVLEIGSLMGPMPEVHIVGVQPREVLPGRGLTQEVGQAVAVVIEEVRRLLAQPIAQDNTPPH